MKLRHALILLVCAALYGEKTVPRQFDACGLGLHKDHPCHCVEHTSDVQNEWVTACLASDPKKTETDCVKTMPSYIRDHCQAAERYGNWQDEGKPMPNQCTSACKMKDCKCDDGPTCHFGHTAADHQGG